MNENQELSILVLSCDGYSDLWDDFFNLRDRFWPDCAYKWYIVTETKEYEREGVEVIRCGENINWAGRFRHAVNLVRSKYILTFLEDFFISSKVDSSIFEEILSFVNNYNVDYLDVGNVFGYKISNPQREYFADHMVIIPKHMKYGISTDASIWKSSYILEKLGEKDCNAWDFEIRLCQEAASLEGYSGLILADDRIPTNVSKIPVVVQGKFYPEAINYFKKLGYTIDTSKRKVMGFSDKLKFDMKLYADKIPHGRNLLKWIGTRIFGYKFFS